MNVHWAGPEFDVEAIHFDPIVADFDERSRKHAEDMKEMSEATDRAIYNFQVRHGFRKHEPETTPPRHDARTPEADQQQATPGTAR